MSYHWQKKAQLKQCFTVVVGLDTLELSSTSSNAKHNWRTRECQVASKNHRQKTEEVLAAFENL